MSEKIKNITLGTDPELFAYSPIEQTYKPLCSLLGGSKTKPLCVVKDEPGFTLQEDNVAAEFTIPPVKNVEDWIKNINFMKDYIQDTVLNPLILEPNYSSSARFKEEYLKSKGAQTMGCDTSYNAYSFKANKVDRSDYTLRTTGFHIHIGYDEPDVETSVNIIKAMDLFLGVPSVMIDPDTERRRMYGKAGEYRLTTYGCEYRVLGGFFLASEELLSWCFNNTMAALKFVNEGGIITNEEEIIEAINKCDKDLAYEIVDDYKVEVLKINLINNY